jgi:hypothetical protein
MTTTYTEKASWFYKPIHIENLEEIQKELISVLYSKLIPNFDTARPMFKIVTREEIEPFAPLYTNFIKSLGLLDRWGGSAIITTNYNIPFPIHIDNIDWVQNSYGLNLPIINCEDTYTVWYDAELQEFRNDLNDIDPNATANDPRHKSRLVKPNTLVKEIARWHMKDPAWINVSIPHRPVSNHNKPRAVMSARFRPELHDLLHK